MKILVFSLIVSVACFKAFGPKRVTVKQENNIDNWLYIAIYKGNSKPILIRKLIFTNADVQSHSLAARPGSLSKYGKLNVLEVHLKPNVMINGVERIIDEYHINKKDRMLPVMIDTSYTYNYPLNTMLATEHSIKSINIQVDPVSSKRYLNINTGAKRIKAYGYYIN